MKAEELRIGNLICDAYGTVLKVTGVKEALIFSKTVDRNVYGTRTESDCFPIPLTEEWLAKFGFIQSKGKYGNDFDIPDKEGNLIMFTVEHWTDVKEDSIWKNHWHTKGLLNNNKLKFVHQLQNLYFARTGEELTFKTT